MNYTISDLLLRTLGAFTPLSPGEGAGAERARLRLAARAKWNAENIPSGERMTRQRTRAAQRRANKIGRHQAKAEAMAHQWPGGAAAVRSL
jgi:hypothetical protein